MTNSIVKVHVRCHRVECKLRPTTCQNIGMVSQ